MENIASAKDRTFGIEIEMCNVDRQKVDLPVGYEWSKDEQIFNTDATTSKRFGGEVNTPPLHLCQKDRYVLKKLYSDMVSAGGKIKWSIDTHVHIYAGDLNVEQLKNIFFLMYHAYPYFKNYCHISDWDEKVFNAQPIPTEQLYERVSNCNTMEELCNAFVNQSKKGFLRCAINIASVFVRKTIEFRCFHASENFELIENCVLASYRMFYYAISHTEEDFKSIDSYEKFVHELKLPKETPPLLIPLIYQGNPYDPISCFMANRISQNARLTKALLEQKDKNLCCVNPGFYSFELSLWRNCTISIYNQDKFCHILYLLANGLLKLKYEGELYWLEEYNTEEILRQVTLVLFAVRLKKYVGGIEYKRVMMEACKAKAEESITKIEKSAKELIEMLTSVEYHWGNLHDALEKEKTIFYQFGKEKSTRGYFSFLKSCSDVDIDLIEKKDDFYNLVESLPKDVKFYIFSDSPYLSNLHKIALFKYGNTRNDGRYLYCNKDPQKSIAYSSYNQEEMSFEIDIPPSDLVINEPEKLKIRAIPVKEFYCLQKQFIKKVDKISLCRYAFIVMYDKYCLGGFGFDLPRMKGFDVWQLSDFCTNNEIPRLSKLILMCLLSKDVKRMLSRGFTCEVRTVITHVYTSKPVSMKYRGLYKKEKELCKEGKLEYSAEFGTSGSISEILNKYQKMIAK